MAVLDQSAMRWILAALFAFTLYHIHRVILQTWNSRLFAKAPSPPSVPWWDIFGVSIVLELQRSLDEARLLEYIHSLFSETAAAQKRRVTTLTLRLLGRTAFITTDPKNIQAVLALQFSDYGLGADRIGSFLPMLGPGIFASDGKPWEHSRAMLRPSFVRGRLEDVALEEKHCQSLLQSLPAADSDGWTPEFDLQPFLFKFTMDTSTEFFFGESSCSLGAKEGSPEAKFVEAFDRGQHYLGQRTSMGPYYWLMNSRSFHADCKIVHQWTDECVRRALEKHASRKATDKEEYVFLDELIDQTQDPIELRSQLLNVLLAGRDTTAGLLTWVFFHLSRRPEMYEELRSVILASFGRYESPKDITFTSLKGCKPLQNLLNETLRLHPSVPQNIRQALKDTTLPRGGGPDGDQSCFVPKGSQIFYGVYLMHRDTELWGPDASEFKPDRWNGLKAGWEYLPFNGGPRICLGQLFSLTTAGYCVVRMLQKFDQLKTTDFQPPKTHVSLTGYNANGAHVSFHKAK